MTSDEALMLEFKGGSRAAFEELFARYHKPLYGFFARRLNNPERAEDLAQETFLAVIRAASRYEPRALVRTYLYGIALKLLAAERRKLLTSSTSGQSAPEPKTDGTPECVLWVQQAMEKLDAPEREILMLREYEQLSYSDIAELLRIPVNTVRSRLFRSRLALKSYLESDTKTNPALRARAGQPHPGRRGVQ
ncbi:MAG TPA: sigma-70 family RNA polymerase sigma factor [Candidatus Sulfotelmatobacter sp.]|jgi:RNA polymerase sigma-70 factor (ECF subfamily)|nr:sigma-70 family RNA polymerase sigma factor [Candidatus Sulfotelmatobacter sp.]